MIKKIIKRFIPHIFLDRMINYKRYRNLKIELLKDMQSEEFKKRKIFYSQFLKEGNIYFDIGANYGNRIGPISTLNLKRIVAVEPQKKCCEVLKIKYRQATILQLGVGAACDEKEFFLSNDSVLSSFSSEFINKTKEKRFKGHSWESSQKVKITTIDKLISMYGVPDFIKIDIEGYELEAIKGLNQKVKVLSFEYTVPELEHNLSPICKKLNSLGTCQFNYSVEECMQLCLKNWKSYEDMAEFLKSKEFLSTGSGDIYVRYLDSISIEEQVLYNL